MSRLDRLHSALMKRMSVVIREIWVEVEATVKDYQKETTQTKTENAKLRQLLKDALTRNQAQLNGQVQPNIVQPTEPPKRAFRAPAESANQVHQKKEAEVQSQDSASDLKPHILEVTSVCKTEAEDREVKDAAPGAEQRLLPQTDSSSANENTGVVLRIKTEPEDTIITITSSVTTAPAHASTHQDSEPAQQLRPANETLRRPQRKECLRTRYGRPRRATAKDHDHDNEGPYKCNKCGRHLKDLAKLQLHKKLHERSFICHWCGRNFSKFDYLRMHMRTHTGERPYRCNWCSKTFSQSGNMRRHERTCQRSNEEPTAHMLDDEQQLSAE